MNQCTFLGRLTRDPEIRYAKDSNMPIARFHIAVDRRRSADNEKNADFFPCVLFDRRAEFAEQYLRSGMRVLISGSMQNNNYTNREGEKVYGVELVGNVIEFADGKRDPDCQEQSASGTENSGDSASGRGAGTANQAGSQTPQAAGTNAQAGGRTSAAGNGSENARTASTSRTSGGRTGAAAQRSAAGRTSASRPVQRAASASYDGFMNVDDSMDESFQFS